MALLAVSVLALLAIGLVTLNAGRQVFAAASGLPAASRIENLVGQPGSERLRPTLLFDRTGEVLLAELGHPRAAGRRWQSLGQLPPAVVQAHVAALDPGFWDRQEGGALEVLRRTIRSGVGDEGSAITPTISERLAAQVLLPADASSVATLMLASDLEARYPRAQILEWYLNSADYGNLAFGLDAAALVYFGKHADELTLAEAAVLAGLLKTGSAERLEDPGEAARLREETLSAMRRLSMISAEEEAEALLVPPIVWEASAKEADPSLGFVGAVWTELKAAVGPGPASLGGGRVITTLDLDLQLQADCVARTHMERMNGEALAAARQAADGSPCVAASFLPPVRPGDAGLNHNLKDVGLVVMDPRQGEVLALIGPADEPLSSGGAAAPFLYLSALARGYTPGTMLVVPPEDSEASGEASLMRLRTGLASGGPAAARSIVDLIGPQAAVRTLELMGLEVPAAFATADRLASGDVTVRMIDLAGALGALANGGVQVGVSPGEAREGLDPTLIRRVVGQDGTTVYEGRTERRAVVSEGLAYLLTDILSDEPARWERLGQGNLLEIGRPAAGLVGDSIPATDNWTVGYTPQRVAVVWTGAPEADPMVAVQALNGAAPIWHAVLRYASRDLGPEDWDQPQDVTSAEVCDPSGYLATPYCPSVVREVFLLGTEPSDADTLYRPFRVNRETGRLATFFTPIDLVEERVYFVPPPEAGGHAQEDLEAPPQEYDRILPPPVDPDVNITSPAFFDVVSRNVAVRGSAGGEGFVSYRLDLGSGLDPQAWLQIGEVVSSPVGSGLLASWSTDDVQGLHVLRLTVVHDDGTVETAAVAVTVDNTRPRVELVLPFDGQVFRAGEDRDVVIDAEVTDESDLAQVVFYVDGRPVLTRTSRPWSMRWPLGAAGEHVIRARATDAAGNSADSDEVRITIER